ncbi:probable plasma membrane ATPase [Schistocerca gregaria]|uniref:probable plasma membrane ATPase n=1 Tax=Schistocerca gregaria TaxID=7010 RepID=UPI00211F1B9A|nr:probable plasma membrane ATPase [Schistocerca gregaria]
MPAKALKMDARRLKHKYKKSLNEFVYYADGFAQVLPEDKHQIVKLLQDQKCIVGMTGDGVNDAPALKRADIGIAVADATDAARATADIVLVAPGLSVIANAIVGSRKIFRRMKSYATYSVAAAVRIVLTFTCLTTIFDYPFPTLAVVMFAIINDGTMIVLARDRTTPSQYPEKRSGLRRINRKELSGVIYLQVSISGLAVVFFTRTDSWFFLDMPHIYLILTFIGAQGVASVIGAYGLGGYVSEGTTFSGGGWGWVLATWIYAIIWELPIDLIKISVQSLMSLRLHSDKSLPLWRRYRLGPKRPPIREAVEQQRKSMEAQREKSGS